MLILGRLAVGFSQTEFAKEIGITQSALSKIEDGLTHRIDGEALNMICKLTGFPEGFFSQEGQHKPLRESFFRKRAVIPLKILKRSEALINIKRMELEKLLSKIDFDECLERPQWQADEFAGGPSEIARNLRCMWGIPRGPISNLVSVVEDAGCIVTYFDFGTQKIDGVTTYASDGTPLIFLNPNFPAARIRITLAHEFGHVIMHRIPTPEMEDEAFEFACEFMMPQQEIRPALFPLNLDMLIRLKLKWKISMQAILAWAKRIGAVKESYYKFIQIKISREGWRTNEPLDDQMERESPTLIPEIIGLHINDLGYSQEDLQKMLKPNRFTFVRDYIGAGHLMAI